MKLSGLPAGEYEVIEVKAPAGYYRDKTVCIQTAAVAAPEDLSGRPEEIVTVEVKYENAKQEIETPPEKPEAPKPVEIVYHPAVAVTKHADQDVYDPGETVIYHIVVANTGDVEDVYKRQGQAQLKAQVAYYMNNAKTILEGLKAAGYTVSGGVNAPYIWLKTPEGMDSWAFFDYLLENAGVVLSLIHIFSPMRKNTRFWRRTACLSGTV